ncbi:MAG: hypothetical protein HRU29_01665 [Rhizobiales bacterium]|nr:hypothetical protein [Hyphomicrobiales bacterium]NRB13082.1 hypothetical protein [Hyphomicrobiales bacterium]
MSYATPKRDYNYLQSLSGQIDQGDLMWGNMRVMFMDLLQNPTQKVADNYYNRFIKNWFERNNWCAPFTDKRTLAIAKKYKVELTQPKGE